MGKTFFDDGLHFSCQKCSGCCRGAPGFVYLSQNDLEKLSKAKNISQDDFITNFCRWVDIGEKEILSLIEKKNNDCIFWNNDGCSVYKDRPFQCSSYPFWFSILRGGIESWKENSKDCPGINKGQLHSKEEILALIKQRDEEPYITRKICM